MTSNVKFVDGVRIENIQSDPIKEVRGQSWPPRSIQKHIEMTSNCTFVDGLGLDLRIFNLTQQKRSEAKVDQTIHICEIWSHFNMFLKWPPRSTLTSDHFCWVRLNIVKLGSWSISGPGPSPISISKVKTQKRTRADVIIQMHHQPTHKLFNVNIKA